MFAAAERPRRSCGFGAVTGAKPQVGRPASLAIHARFPATLPACPTRTPPDGPAPAATGDGKKLLYLIDTYSLVFQVFHAIPPMTGPKGQPTNAVFGFTRDLRQILREKRPSHLVLCLEGDGKGDRAELYADYKAHRDEMPADLRSQIPVLIDVARGPRRAVRQAHDGQEADDVLATLATRAAADGFDVRIVTSDKDARQLIGDRVALYNCRSGKTMDAADLLEDWGVRPDQVTDFQGLVGDSSDNIPGVPKVGPAAARELLEKYGTLDGVLEHAAELDDAGLNKRTVNKTVRANLRDPALQEQARLSRTLATLRTDLPLEVTWEQAAVTKPDSAKLLALFTDLGFKTLSDEARAASDDEPEVVIGAGGYVRRKRTAGDDPGDDLDWRTVDTAQKFAAFAAKLDRQAAFCVDLETTSLDAVRADLVGWAFCWQPGRAHYLPVRGPEGTAVLDGDAVLERLRPILTDPDRTVHNQNLKYDLTVLRRHGIDIPTAAIGTDPMVCDYLLAAGERSHSLDTLSLRYLNRRTTGITELIGTGKQQKQMFEVEVPAVSAYAAEDADVAWQLAELLGEKLKAEHLWELYQNLERPLIPILSAMESRGIKIDTAELASQSAEITVRLAELETEIHELAGHEFNVKSNKQLQAVLFDELKLPVVKRTKTGPSTDAEVLEKLAPKHPLPEKVQEHRTLAKLQGTYVDALPKLVNPETGRVHCSFNQVVTSTGRLSSSDPNLQNIPVRTPEGRRVRKAFIPGGEGWVILTADYSQIELRMLAHFSGDEALVAAFREDRDVHAAVAAEIFGIPEGDVTKEQRAIAKTTNFGVIYGQSAYGLSATLGIPQEEADAFIKAYLENYAGVRKLIENTLDTVRNTGYARTILGRRREVTGIRPRSRFQGTAGQMNLPERTAFNAVIQGSAADLIKTAMLRVEDRIAAEGHPGRMLLQIHDELLFEVPGEQAGSLGELVREEMIGAMELSVPLKVDVGVGPNWLDAK